MMTTVFHLDASTRSEGSASRRLSQYIASRLTTRAMATKIIKRETGDGAVFIDADWVNASFTAESERDQTMTETLRQSDELVNELFQADYIVIGLPLYNFTVPSTLKAWVDHIARPGLSFSSDENGFEGLLKGKKAYLAVVSGSTDIEGPMDFATPYLKQVLGFLGVTDVTVFSASNLVIGDGEKILEQAFQDVDKVFPKTTEAA